MHLEPLDRRAWPDYRADAGRWGDMAVLLARNAADPHRPFPADPLLAEHFAILAARKACRSAWIVIFGNMTMDELKREGF